MVYKPDVDEFSAFLSGQPGYCGALTPGQVPLAWRWSLSDVVTAHSVRGAIHVQKEHPAVRAQDFIGPSRLGVQLPPGLAVVMQENPVAITQFLVLFLDTLVIVPLVSLLGPRDGLLDSWEKELQWFEELVLCVGARLQGRLETVRYSFQGQVGLPPWGNKVEWSYPCGLVSMRVVG